MKERKEREMTGERWGRPVMLRERAESRVRERYSVLGKAEDQGER